MLNHIVGLLYRNRLADVDAASLHEEFMHTDTCFQAGEQSDWLRTCAAKYINHSYTGNDFS